MIVSWQGVESYNVESLGRGKILSRLIVMAGGGFLPG